MTEYTESGNRIYRNFTMCDGWSTFIQLLDKGWKELYYEAPYHWGIVHLKDWKIYTFTEGDTDLIICDNKQKLKSEILEYLEYFKSGGYSTMIYAEMVSLLSIIDSKFICHEGD